MYKVTKSILVTFVIFISISVMIGCSGKYNLDYDLSEAPDDYKEFKTEYKDFRAEVIRKKELYVTVRNDLYPKVRETILNNWNSYTTEEKQLFRRIDKKAKRFDDDITEFYNNDLKEFDKKVQNKSDKLEELYSKFLELKETKEKISDFVGDVLDAGNKVR
jgi:hypothetical protein